MNWWRRLLHKSELEKRLVSELAFHFEQQTAANIRAGMSAEEACRAAHLQFGTVEGWKEECRDARGTRLIENAVQDIRFSLRSLRGSPSFTIVAVLCLGLGIGANTAIFSVIDALMLRTLPVKQPQQLVLLGEGQAQGANDGFPNSEPDLFSWRFYQELRAKSGVFSDVLAIQSSGADGHARFGRSSAQLEPIKMQLVSGNFFQMLGVPAFLGRVLLPADGRKGTAPVAVMRYGYWQRRFANDRSVIGRTLSVNGTAITIVGVAAPEFFGTVVGASPDFWVPLAAQVSSDPLTQTLWLIGRMKTGATLAAASANTNVVFQQWLHGLAGSPPSPERVRDMQLAQVKLMAASRGLSHLRRTFSRPLQILMVLVGLVLLIACANIANLLLARAAARQREIALRMALGASRRRLVGQLLCESFLLALAGGGLGLLISIAGARLLMAMVANGAAAAPIEAGLNITILFFTFALCFLTGLVFGIVPAFHLTAVDAGPTLKEGQGLTRSQSHSRLGRSLVVGQVALAFFLTVSAALFVNTLQKLEQANTGFEKERVLLLQLDSHSSSTKGPALFAQYRRLLSRVEELPGVTAASFSEVTFDEGHWRTLVWPQGVVHSEANGRTFNGDHVSAQYFRVLGTPLVMGRTFGPRDTPQSPPVAVVNQTFARTVFPNRSPLGLRFLLEGNAEYEIVGVVKDARYESVRERPLGAFFVSNEQDADPAGFSDLVVRTKQQPRSVINEIRRTVQSEIPDLAISQARTLAEQVDRSLNRERLLANLAGFFGVLALLLASLGLYGIVAYSVARRTNEIGIRMALGARPAMILRAMLCEALVVVALGLALGLGAVLACGRLISSQLYEVTANDPLVMGGAAALLIAAALAASFIPGRRAAMLDPLIALRHS